MGAQGPLPEPYAQRGHDFPGALITAEKCMEMMLMYNQNFYNTHEAYSQLTYFMHRWGPNMDTNYLVRQVEHQFKLFYNSRRKEDFVSFCECRLAIENLTAENA